MNETVERLSTRVHLMMAPSELRAIDDYRRQQSDLASRAEAIRRLVEFGLAGAKR